MPGSTYGEINKSGMTESFVLGYVLLLRGCGIEAESPEHRLNEMPGQARHDKRCEDLQRIARTGDDRSGWW